MHFLWVPAGDGFDGMLTSAIFTPVAGQRACQWWMHPRCSLAASLLRFDRPGQAVALANLQQDWAGDMVIFSITSLLAAMLNPWSSDSR